MKDEEYIKKITIIAEADIRNGGKAKLEALIPKLIGEEDYEACAGIKRAIDNESDSELTKHAMRLSESSLKEDWDEE